MGWSIKYSRCGRCPGGSESEQVRLLTQRIVALTVPPGHTDARRADAPKAKLMEGQAVKAAHSVLEQ